MWSAVLHHQSVSVLSIYCHSNCIRFKWVFVVILWLSSVYIYVVLFYTCRPDTQDTDSDDSDDGRLVIDVTSEAGGENTPMPSCSSVSGGESDVGLPTGDGVFSPLLLSQVHDGDTTWRNGHVHY